jgi:amino acid adenylation domain-containing protein
MGVFVRELAALYEAYVGGKESPLPELPIQYADYAVWQREWLSGEVLERQLAYWRKQLEGAPAAIELPADYTRPVAQTYHGGHESGELGETVSAQLRQLSRSEGVTLFVTMLAAFKALLWRYGGGSGGAGDVVVGTPVAGRGRLETEGLIGLFVNTLVLRTRVGDNPTFRELLKQVRDVVIEGHAHQDVPFEKLVEALQPERDMSRSPLFQVMFGWQAEPLHLSHLKGLEVSAVKSHTGTAKFDLTVIMDEGPRGLICSIEYNSDLFAATTIRRMLGHYQLLLESVVTSVEQRVADLTLLSDNERQQILVEWNDTETDYANLSCVHKAFEAQVERTPDALALTYEGEHLTYRELNARANRLAHRLQRLGVKPEVRVGVYIERSLEMVAALLGVLKAGGAYVPFDPEYPQERFAFMLADVQPKVLLTQEQLLSNLPPHHAEVIRLDSDWGSLADESDDNPIAGVTGGNLIYVIYTSGSTGQPKGVMNTHQGVMNRLLWMQQEFALTAGDCVLQKTPFSFDVSVWEFFWPLLTGARLVLAKPGGHRNGRYLVNLINREQITHLHFVPPMLQAFLNEPGVQTCTSVRRVICSGEALSAETQEKFHRRLGARLYNLYGPTEAAIDVSHWASRPDDDARSTSSSKSAPRAADLCLHEMFEAQVERTPDAVAIMFEEEQLTYRELNGLANQIARRLRRLGVGPETRLSIYLEPSIGMVAGLLGVLKAGGAYVPLDPSHPQERLSYIVRDAQVKVMLTQEYLLPVLPVHDAQVVCLDSELSGIVSESVEKARSGVTADNLAYVIYTSGSTGRPKGVMVAHRAVCNHMLWMQSQFALHGEDSLLQKTTFSFDASIWELFLPLMSGARLIMAAPGGQRDSAYLVETIVKQRVTVLQVVPSMLQVLLDEPGIEKCESLRLVFCGGESLPLELVESFRARLGWVQLHNLYGPTEAAIDVSHLSCGRARDRFSKQPEAVRQKHEPAFETSATWRVNGTVPIGRPIANTQLYVLDAALQPVPVGVDGELYIGGVQLARGYLRRPGLTAERFIPDPYANELGRRLYRTGDVARYLSDGNLVFVGRRDQQVKIRGHRIEMGEIEAALDTHPRIRQSVVLAREDVPGDKRLIAYLLGKAGTTAADVVANAETNGGIAVSEVDEVLRYELRGHLRERLPEYMVPSAFVFVSRLPLTPNGKVDRKALPAPSAAGVKRHGSAASAPRSHLEDALATLWAEVLAVDSVSPTDNFFELGGHSLLAMQVVSRVRERLGAEVGVGRLFAAPTLAGFAGEVERALREGEGLTAPPLLRVARVGQALPLSFAQQRLWFLEQLESGTALYNIPAAVRLKGRLETEAIARALAEIVRRHEVLRTSFVSEGGEPVQVIAPSVDVPLIVEAVPDQEDQERWVSEVAQEEARRGFDLGQGPLLRVRLLRLAAEEHVALLTMHHIVSDGWSMGVFVRELAALYEAYVGGKESPLPELPIQYADYAVWQREWLSGEVLERQLAYWRRQLEGAPAAIELPADYTRPVTQIYRGANEGREVGEAVSARLRQLSRSEGVTLFVTMLAAFKALLWRYGGGAGGAGDVVVGTPVAGRGRLETEGLIGFFVNTLVLRTKIGDNPTFRELLKQVRDVVLGGYNHQDLPFVKLVEAVNPERQAGYSPLVQVCFFLDMGPMALLELPGLTLSPVDITTGIAQFDLVLGVSDTGPRLSTNMQYNADVFAPATVRHMLSLYELLLCRVVAQPDVRLDQLSKVLAEADEQQRIMREKTLEELSFGTLRRIKRKVVGESSMETTA